MDNNKKLKIVAIDDEPESGWLISRILEAEGHLSFVSDNGPDGLNTIRRVNPDAVFLDLRLPGMDGLEVLRRIREFDKELMVIILSAFDSFETSVHAMNLGAYDFLTKPLNVEELKITLKNALRTQNLVLEVQTLKRQAEQTGEEDRLIGNCKAMRTLYHQVERAGQHSISVMLFGESGTGKKMLARAVHCNSSRRQGPFVSVPCSILSEKQIESELFGYEAGAFSGAGERTRGFLEKANQGTLFLDEIEKLPACIQKKLLRAIQERVFCRLGGKAQVPVDLRLIAATNQDLQRSTVAGSIQEDLFYRLNELSLTLPPLRDRGDDIYVLAKYFMDKYNREFQKNVLDISPETKATLETYLWPGNVRELKSVIKRAVILASNQIRPEHLPPEVLGATHFNTGVLLIQTKTDEIRPIKEVSREVVTRVERELILRALEKSGGNKVKTARWLGIDYKTLFNKLKQYHIDTSLPPVEEESEPMQVTVPLMGEPLNTGMYHQI